MAVLAQQDWVMAALQALGRLGIQGVRVESLAVELQVTKGSFYHHFSKRQHLLNEVLALWQSVATEQVIEQTNASAQDAAERLMNLAILGFSDKGNSDQIEAGIRDWAATSTKVAVVVAKIDSQRISYVQMLLEESGVDAQKAEGRAHVMYRALIARALGSGTEVRNCRKTRFATL